MSGAPGFRDRVIKPGEDGWGEILEQLQQRFPDISPQDIAEALKGTNGHAGRAASTLRSQSSSNSDYSPAVSSTSMLAQQRLAELRAEVAQAAQAVEASAMSPTWQVSASRRSESPGPFGSGYASRLTPSTPSAPSSAGSRRSSAPCLSSAPCRRDSGKRASLGAADLWSSSYQPSRIAHRTNILTYPCGTTIALTKDLFEIMASAIDDNASSFDRMLLMLRTGAHTQPSMQAYRQIDKDSVGSLQWSTGSIRLFIGTVFRQLRLRMPSEPQCRYLYQVFDREQHDFLEARACLCLVDSILSAIFHPDARLDTANGGEMGNGTGPCSSNASSGPTNVDVRVVGTPSGKSINHPATPDITATPGHLDNAYASASPSYRHMDFRAKLPQTTMVNRKHQERMSQVIGSGQHVRIAFEVFQACDTQGCGCLTWNDGAMHRFIQQIFARHGLELPGEEIDELVRDSSIDNPPSVEARTCLCLQDAILRSVFREEAPVQVSDDREAMRSIQRAEGRGNGLEAPAALPKISDNCGEAEARGRCVAACQRIRDSRKGPCDDLGDQEFAVRLSELEELQRKDLELSQALAEGRVKMRSLVAHLQKDLVDARFSGSNG